MATYITEKVNAFRKEIPNFFSVHVPLMIKGATIAVNGICSNLNPKGDLNQKYWKFLTEGYLPVLIPMYIAFATFAFFFFPLTIAILVFAPAILWQILTAISVWGLHIAQKKHPVEHGQLFIEGVRQVDSALAREYEQEMKSSVSAHHQSWMQAIRESLDDKLYFWTWSLIYLSFSIVPILGSIMTALAQTYLVVQKLSYRLLDTYMTKIEKMNDNQQLQFINRHWALLVGFCLPFAMLSSIPVIGPFTLLYAEVTIGKLFCSEIHSKRTPVAG
jgi:hypothetical protein